MEEHSTLYYIQYIDYISYLHNTASVAYEHKAITDSNWITTMKQVLIALFTLLHLCSSLNYKEEGMAQVCNIQRHLDRTLPPVIIIPQFPVGTENVDGDVTPALPLSSRSDHQGSLS